MPQMLLLMHVINHLSRKSASTKQIPAKNPKHRPTSIRWIKARNSPKYNTIQRQCSLRRRPLRRNVPPRNILNIPKLWRLWIQRWQQLQQTLRCFSMNHFKCPTFTTMNPSKNQQTCQQKSQKWPTPSFTMKQNHILMITKQKPTLTNTKKMLNKWKWQKRTTLIVFWIIHNNNIIITHYFSEIASLFAVAKIER